MSYATRNVLPLNATDWLAPRWWPMWLLLGAMRVSALLPLRVQQFLGNALGRFAYRVAKSRVRVAKINIRQAYPDYDEPQVDDLARACFRNLGCSFFDMSLAWFRPMESLRTFTGIEGLEHLHKPMAEGRGVILLCSHMSTMEIGGCLICLYAPINAVYKKSHNPMFNAAMAHYRSRWSDGELFDNKQVRGIIRALRRGGVLWYAPDQDFSDQDIVFTPFLGGVATTLTATARMAGMANAAVVPFGQRRLANGRGYRLILKPALENFPDEDIEVASARVNRAIEEMVYENPEDYGWVHKRFKRQPPGMPPLY